MLNLNKVTIAGNITRDIELKSTPRGTRYCSFGVAINRRWKSEDGTPQNEVTFVECQAWGKTSEVIAKHLKKGSPIFVDGRLSQDNYEDKDGVKKSKTRIVVEEFQFLPSGHLTQTGARTAPEPPNPSPMAVSSTLDLDGDDIPF